MRSRFDWHAWFAWYPVRLRGTLGRYVWMRTVRRRRELFERAGEWWVYDEVERTR